MPHYTVRDDFARSQFMPQFRISLKKGDLDRAMTLMRAFFSGIHFDTEPQNEAHYQTMFYLIYRLITPFLVRVEERSAQGRADAVVETVDTVYAFEFKLDGSADEALAQIGTEAT